MHALEQAALVGISGHFHSLLNASLSIRAYAPLVHTHFTLWERSWGDLVPEAGSPPAVYAVLCSEGRCAVHTDLDALLAALRSTAPASGHPQPRSLETQPFDHVLPCAAAPTVVLYAPLQHSDTPRWLRALAPHTALRAAAGEDGHAACSASLVFRHSPAGRTSAQDGETLHLQGVGVELMIRGGEYKFADQNDAPQEEEAEAEGEEDELTALPPVLGVDIPRLAARRPDLRGPLHKVHDALVAEAGGTQLPITKIQSLGLQATQHVVASKDPLQALADLPTAFPTLAPSLSRLAVPKGVRADAERISEAAAATGGRPGLLLNGRALPPDVTPFRLIDAVREELVHSSALRALNLSKRALADLQRPSHLGVALAEPPRSERALSTKEILSSPQLRVAFDPPAALYLSDVEKDPRFAGWSSDIRTILQPSWPGQPRPIQRNLYTVVALGDLASPPAQRALAIMAQFAMQGAPLRFAFVPVGDSDASLRLARLYLAHTLRHGALAAAELFAIGMNQGIDTPDRFLHFAQTSPFLARQRRSWDRRELESTVDGQGDALVEELLSGIREQACNASLPTPVLLFNGRLAELALIGSELGHFIDQETRLLTGLVERGELTNREIDAHGLPHAIWRHCARAPLLPSETAAEAPPEQPAHQGVAHPIGLLQATYFPLVADARAPYISAPLPWDTLPDAAMFRPGGDTTAVPLTHAAVFDPSRAAHVLAAAELTESLHPTLSRLALVVAPSLRARTGASLHCLLHAAAGVLPAHRAPQFIAFALRDRAQRLHPDFSPATPEDRGLARGIAFAEDVVRRWGETCATEVADDSCARWLDLMLASLRRVTEEQLEAWASGHNVFAAAVLRDVPGTHPVPPFVLSVNGRIYALAGDDPVLTGPQFLEIQAFEDLARARPLWAALDALGSDAADPEAMDPDQVTAEWISDAISQTAWRQARFNAAMQDLLGVSGHDSAQVAAQLRARLPVAEEVSHASFVSQPDEEALLHVTAVIDPLNPEHRHIAPLLRFLRTHVSAAIEVLLAPPLSLSKAPLQSYYQYLLPQGPSFGPDGALLPSAARLSSLPSTQTLTLNLHTPPNWLVSALHARDDLDNIRLGPPGASVHAVFGMDAFLVSGRCGDGHHPAQGLQLALTSPAPDPHVFSTLVMANLGYYQLHAARPGVHEVRVEGRARSLLSLRSAVGMRLRGPHEGDVAVTSWEGAEVELVTTPLAQETNLYGRVEESSSPGTASGGSGLWKSIKSALDGGRKKAVANTTINVFTIASGHMYERLVKIMMLSVLNHTEAPVKFWFLGNFASPAFRTFIPHMAERFGFDYAFVSYTWPWWLHAQSEKMRRIWAYKILFLDVLFPQDVGRVIFVDADQVVRTDLAELMTMDFHGAPYAYTPFCDSRTEMEGFRFWKRGYWKNHLRGKPYHISALFAVDLTRFRELGAGDTLRMYYESLSRDENSLSNLDQDLPNFAQHVVPIHSLPQEWLWCESWCSDESQAAARTIDLCNNPSTKEHKLASARRIIKEWSSLHDRVLALEAQLEQEASPAKQVRPAAPAPETPATPAPEPSAAPELPDEL